MKKTYIIPKMKKSTLKSVKTTEGITMEGFVNRFLNNQVDAERTQPLIYTERKDGVMAGYDIRSDAKEIAIDAMDKSSASMIAKRQNNLTIVKEEDAKGDSIEGTDSK